MNCQGLDWLLEGLSLADAWFSKVSHVYDILLNTSKTDQYPLLTVP